MTADWKLTNWSATFILAQMDLEKTRLFRCMCQHRWVPLVRLFIFPVMQLTQLKVWWYSQQGRNPCFSSMESRDVKSTHLLLVHLKITFTVALKVLALIGLRSKVKSKVAFFRAMKYLTLCSFTHVWLDETTENDWPTPIFWLQK